MVSLKDYIEACAADDRLVGCIKYAEEAGLEFKFIAVSGAGGAGKSTLAGHLGKEHKAIVIRSDIVGKLMCGRSGDGLFEPLAPETYENRDFGRQKAEAVQNLIKAVLAQGYSVVTDHVAAVRPARERLETLADEANVDFVGLWLDVDLETRAQRVEGRVNDVSDGNADVVRKFREPQRPRENEAVWGVIDANNRTADEVAAVADEMLRDYFRSGR